MKSENDARSVLVSNEYETESSRRITHETHVNDADWKYFYIDPDGVKALQNFQYKGADNSLIYKYILSPLAQWCVDTFIPTSMAPNTITLLGLLLMVSSYVVVGCYCLQFDSLISKDEDANGSTSSNTWVFVYSGICMLVYQTLDNMDGKQARKTGSSSPLGLLFDHGCDAANCVIGITNWCCAMGLDVSDSRDVRIITLLTISAYTPFYLATWEEYHTGALILPIINGVTEGLILAASLMFTAGIYGPEFWHDGTHLYDYGLKYALDPPSSTFAQLAARFVMHNPNAHKWRNCECLMIVTYFLLTQEVVGKVWTVVSNPSLYAGGFFKPFERLAPFIICVVCFLVIGTHGAVGDDNSDRLLVIWQRHPRISLLFSSTLFVEMATQLMLSHMTLSEYGVTKWGGRLVMAPLAIYAGLLLLMSYLGTSTKPLLLSPLYEDYYLIAYTSAMVVHLGMKITYVIHEICYAMNIWCFDIVTPRGGTAPSKKKKL